MSNDTLLRSGRAGVEEGPPLRDDHLRPRVADMQARLRTRPHLEFRPTSFHWRRRWPRRILATFSPETKHRSVILPLHTHVMPDARLLARTLTHLSDVAFAGVTERNMAIVPDIMDRLVVELRRFQISAVDVAREAAAAHDLACVNAAMKTLRTALVTRDAPEGRGRLIPRMHGPAEPGHLFPAVLHGPSPGRSLRPSPGFRGEKSPSFAAENHPTPFPPQNRSTDVPSIPAATETRNA